MSSSNNDEAEFFKEKIFENNVKIINAHNANKSRTFNMGLNAFTDVDEDQFITQYATLVIPDDLKAEAELQQLKAKQSGTKVYTTPPSVVIDWKCKASPINDQGACGSSYIFTAL